MLVYSLFNPNRLTWVHCRVGDADGMVSGATHTTAATIRPGLQACSQLRGETLLQSVQKCQVPCRGEGDMLQSDLSRLPALFTTGQHAISDRLL